jgi:type IV pilus assembly protein PilA
MLNRLRCALRDREEGFTLIELLVVMIIIGILAAIAIPVFLNQRNSGYDASTKSDVKNGSTAEETYFTDNNTYTTNAGGTAGTSSGNLSGWSKSGNTTGVSFTLVGTTGYKIVGVSKSGKSWCFNSTASGSGVIAGSTC